MKTIRQCPAADNLARREAFYKELRKEHTKRIKGFNTLSVETCFNVAQTYTLAEAMIADCAQSIGLTLAGVNVLTILRKHKETGCPLNSLSHLLIVSRANITGLMDSLVRKGLVTRREHSHDRRVVLAQITKKGEELMDSYLPAHYKAIASLSNPLTRKEKTMLIGLLTRMRQGLLH